MTDLSNTTIESDADVVVVFEKESFFDLMIKQGVLLELFALGIKAVFVTGKGRPDLNTLELLYKLHAKHACKRHPIVTDGDACLVCKEACANRHDEMLPCEADVCQSVSRIDGPRTTSYSQHR